MNAPRWLASIAGRRVLFTSIVLVNVAASTLVSGPIVHGDEAGYLGFARHITGGLRIHMGPATLFHPGASFVFAPAVAIGGSPEADYALILATQALMVGALFFVLVRVADLLLPERRELATGVALVSAAYPAVIFHANLAWSETSFMLAFSLMALAALRLPSGPTAVRAVQLATWACACYLLHPRATLFPIAVAAALLVGAATRWLPRNTVTAGTAVAALGFVAVRLLLRWVAAVSHEGFQGHGDSERISGTLTIDRIPDTATFIAGRLWYLGIATGGLALIGAFVLVASVVRWRGQAGHFAMAVLGICWLSVLVVTAHLALDVRADFAVYGRYVDGLSPVVLVIGLATIAKLEAAARLRWLMLALVTTLPLALIVRVHFADVLGRPFAIQNSPVLRPFIENFDTLRIGWATVIFVVAGGLAALLSRYRVWLWLCFLGLAWVGISWSTLRWQETQSNALAVQGEYAAELMTDLGLDHVSMYWPGLSSDEAWNIQWWAEDTKFSIYATQGVNELPAPASIDAADLDARSGGAWNMLEPLIGTNNRVLWIRDGDEAEVMIAAGLVLPDGFPQRLPDEARHVSLNVASASCRQLDSSYEVAVEVRIVHIGAGSPLPPPSGAFGVSGAVRVRVVAGDGAAAPFLSEGLVPGESTSVIAEFSTSTRPELIRISAEQQDYGTFERSEVTHNASC